MDDLTRFLRQNRYNRIGICGRAGSGKTTLTHRLAEALGRERGVQPLVYSGDYRFVQDSEARAAAIRQYWAHSPQQFAAHVNQFSWWDFERIVVDLKQLARGEPVVIPDAYDRTTGLKSRGIRLAPEAAGEQVLLYENAILGPEPVIEQLDVICFLTTPEEVCLARVLQKDRGRRPFDAILARTLITRYSESLHYAWLQRHFRHKLLFVTEQFDIAAEQHAPSVDQDGEVTYLAYPVEKTLPRGVSHYRGTIFCDLDGTLVKHVEVPSDSGEDLCLLPGAAETLRRWRAAGYEIVLCTGRKLKNFLSVEPALRRLGITYDRFLCDLAIGPRVVINDNKGDEVRALSIALTRDQGIASVDVTALCSVSE